MARVDFHTPRVTQLREARRGKGRKGGKVKEVRRSKDEEGKMDGGRNKCKKERKEGRKESWGDKNGCIALQNLL